MKDKDKVRLSMLHLEHRSKMHELIWGPAPTDRNEIRKWQLAGNKRYLKFLMAAEGRPTYQHDLKGDLLQVGQRVVWAAVTGASDRRITIPNALKSGTILAMRSFPEAGGRDAAIKTLDDILELADIMSKDKEFHDYREVAPTVQIQMDVPKKLKVWVRAYQGRFLIVGGDTFKTVTQKEGG